MEDLTRVCAWCKKLLNPDNTTGAPYKPNPNDKVTHGMCQKCHDEAMSQIETESFACWLHTRNDAF